MNPVAKIAVSNPATGAEIDQAHAQAVDALRGARSWALVWVEPGDDDEPVVRALSGGTGPLTDFLSVAGGCDLIAARTQELVMEALLGGDYGEAA